MPAISGASGPTIARSRDDHVRRASCAPRPLLRSAVTRFQSGNNGWTGYRRGALLRRSSLAPRRRADRQLAAVGMAGASTGAVGEARTGLILRIVQSGS